MTAAAEEAPAGDESVTPIDPVTREVVTSRLQTICDEGADAAKAVSASPIVYAVGDVETGIVLADATPVVGSDGGGGITLGEAVAQTIARCSENPGIEEGDMFVMNDPFLGVTRHQPDVVIVAPIHYQGQLVAWVGSMCHHLDTGAMSPGGWIPGAVEVYQEGYRFPPLKLVERGELRSDIFGAIMTMVRSADKVALDYRGQIAANNVIRRKFIAVCERYGFPTVESVLRENVRRSAERIAERIKQLPDATVTAKVFLERNNGSERELLRYVLTVVKDGSDLTFDFTGTDLQRMGPTNAALVNAETRYGPRLLRFTIGAEDVEYNVAFRDALRVIAPEGTLINPVPPAPVSAGVTIGAVAMQLALNKLYLCSEDHLASTSGLWLTMASHMVMMGGVNQFGKHFTYSILDSDGHGTGGMSDRDGVDTGGDLIPRAEYIANVEFHEASNPVLFRYRRQAIDSGGPGRFRGGVGLEEAWTPHKTERPLMVTLTSFSTEGPTTMGVSGGMPGALNRAFVVDEMSAEEFRSVDETVPTARRLPAAVAGLALRPGQHLFLGNVGGGGYGDPLDRDPVAVLADVRYGVVSREAALGSYGVVVTGNDDELAVDGAETEAARQAIRDTRLESAVMAKQPPEQATRHAKGPLPITRIGADIEIVDDGDAKVRCRRCSYVYCLAGENHKEYAAMEEASLASAHGILREVPELVLRRYYCPGCAVQFWVDIAEKGEPIAFDVKLTQFSS